MISAAGFAAAAAAFLAVPKRYLKSVLLKLERLTSPKKVLHQTPSEVFVSKNGTPQQNVAKVIEMMGGIQRFIGKQDIVILKPNAQWWNQGRTNLAAMKGFIDIVLSIPDFYGEIIIAENHHYMNEALPENQKDNVRGWVHLSEINGNIDGVNHSLNSLIALFNDGGFKNVTKCHWRDGGAKSDLWPCPNGQNGGIITSPAEKDGYLWSDIDYIFEGLWGLKKWKVKMTYPIFTSAYSGITIDLKNGPFQRDGKGGGYYLGNRAIKLINFAALNDHGPDTGITGAIKNYMGITDLSCGWLGLQPEGYANVHSCGSDYYPYCKAGPLGHFMKTIRKADLNIVTAEWVGWGSHTDITKASRLRTIIAGTDPVALDYYGARELLYPLSKNRKYHDPDNPNSSIRNFLDLAHNAYGKGAIGGENLNIFTHDFSES